MLVLLLLFFSTKLICQDSLSTSHIDTLAIIDNHIKKAVGYQSVNIKSALQHIEAAYELAEKINDTALIIKINYGFGLMYKGIEKDSLAKQHLLRAINLSIKTNDITSTRNSYNLLGLIEDEMLNYSKAIEYYKLALVYAEDEKDKLATRTNLSKVFFNLGKNDLAQQYTEEILIYFKGKDYYEFGVDEKNVLLTTYINLSNLKKPKEAIKLLKESLKIIKTDSNLNFRLPLVYSSIGEFYAKTSFKDSTIFYLDKALSKAKEINLEEEVLINSFLISYYSLKYKQNNKALKYLDSVFYFSGNKLGKEVVNIPVDSLSFEVYKANGLYNKATKHAVNFISYQDSISKNKVNDSYLEFAKKYETEKKIQENELLKKENVIKELEVGRQKTARNYLMIFSVLGFVTLSFTYSQLRSKRKTASALAKQNDVILQQKIALQKSNANKQKLFGIISHDLVNPFNAILGYTELLDKDYNNFNEQERKKFISIINNYANNNYNLTRTLLDWAKVQQEQLIVNKQMINCKELIENVIQPYKVMADKKQIEIITKNIPNNIEVSIDKNMTQTIIGNLFVNAIKYTSQGGKVEFNLIKNKNGTINIEIQDNGLGMSQEQLGNLFDITKVTSVKGTNQEKGNGMGLILCKELIELQNGSLKLFSQLNNGTRAVVNI
ncbi:tetratricopeptide repeat-containing sensor histidine kinase [Algibacter agarivorans]